MSVCLSLAARMAKALVHPAPLARSTWRSTKHILKIAQGFRIYCRHTTTRVTAAMEVNALSWSTRRKVGIWLLASSGMCFGAVVIGGVTRLTESGLSITEWNVIKGIRPPWSEAEWRAEYEKYSKSPEFKYKNKDISMDDFKWIWKMEYFHRLWGRATGFIFILPAAYFWSRGYLTRKIKIRVGILGALIGLQGVLGWYMVKSGLRDTGSEYVTRVSQYRLAAHLGLALIVYTGITWSALTHLLPAHTNLQIVGMVKKLRKYSHGSKILIFLTAFSGAFVAGLDAGLVYNSFPKMADRWVPSDIGALTPRWKNLFENPSTVQFEHRILCTLTFVSICATWLVSRRAPVPRRTKMAAHSLLAALFAQVSLGIATLLYYVPTYLAASHQAGAMVTLSSAIWLTHELRRFHPRL